MIKVILCALNEAKNLKILIPNLANCLKTCLESSEKSSSSQLAQNGLASEVKDSEQIQKSSEPNFEIIICIDGSNDNSSQLLYDFQKIYPIKVLPTKNQRGLGLALNRAFLAAVRNCKSDDLVINFDADNSHNPKQIKEMIAHFKNYQLDVLIASRFCEKSTMKTFPPHRRLISFCASIALKKIIAAKKISGKKLLDYTSGYRIYKASKLQELHKIYQNNLIQEPDFTSTCELLLKLNQLNCRIDEIPLIYEYASKIGSSKLRIWRNSWQLLLLIFKAKFTKFQMR